MSDAQCQLPKVAHCSPDHTAQCDYVLSHYGGRCTRLSVDARCRLSPLQAYDQVNPDTLTCFISQRG